MSSIMQEEFNKALKKLEEGRKNGKFTKDDLEKVQIWGEFIKAKADIERERRAKKI